MEEQELGFNFISLSAHRPSRVFVKPFPLHSAVDISSFDPTTPVVSNSQGKRTRLIKELGAISFKDFHDSPYEELRKGECTRLIKELRAISVKDSFPSRPHFSASFMELHYSLTGIKCNYLLLSDQRRSHVCSTAKPIPRSPVDSSSLSAATAMLSNSQGELADKLTRLRKEVKKTMYLYKSSCKEYQAACREYQAMSATGKGKLKDKLTKLLRELQQTMSAEDLYNSACQELQAMSADYLCNFDYQELYAMSPEYLRKFAWNSATVKRKLADNLTRLRKEHFQTIFAEPIYSVACYSATEKRKYEVGTSPKGKERMEGEGEDDVTAQYVDAIGSVVNEPLKDDDLLFSLPSQPPNSALSQTADERDHNFALPQRTEGTEHNSALSQRTEGTENKNWVKGLGSKVSHGIYIGMRVAAPCIGLYYMLNKDAGKKFDDLALQLKALNEALGATGCPPPTVSGSNPNITNNYHVSLVNVGNPSTTVSPSPSGLLNRANPSTMVTSFVGLINIGKFYIGNRGNGVEETGNK